MIIVSNVSLNFKPNEKLIFKKTPLDFVTDKKKPTQVIC